VSASPASTAACPNCSADVPEAARFCPSCGARLEAGSTAVIPPPPDETGRVPVSVTSVEPHLFGVTPPLAVLVLALAAIALGVLLLGLGRLLPGILLLVAGAALLLVFISISREVGTRELGDRVRFAATSLSVRSAAAREATRLRHELARLQQDRNGRVRALGEAVYAGSEADTEAVRGELAALDDRIAETERELALVAARAQEQVAKAKLEVQATEMVEIPDSPGIEPQEPVRIPEPYPPPGEGQPPEPARIPEPYPPPDEGDIPEPPPPGEPAERGSGRDSAQN
jgi:4-amino-4-deoxy-L-arabinose transferase-like glycosyltransferase